MALIHSAPSGVEVAGIQIRLVYGRFSNSARTAHRQSRTACSDVSEPRSILRRGGVPARCVTRAGAGQMPSSVREAEFISVIQR